MGAEWKIQDLVGSDGTIRDPEMTGCKKKPMEFLATGATNGTLATAAKSIRFG